MLKTLAAIDYLVLDRGVTSLFYEIIWKHGFFLKNFKLLKNKKYYFNIFLNKKYFQLQPLLQFQTYIRVATPFFTH